jgi:essential nuclear protein 1
MPGNARASDSDDDSDDDFGDGSMVVRQGDFVEAADMTPADEAALAQFLPRQSDQRRTLGDIIADKIREREAAAAGGDNSMQDDAQQQRQGNGASITYSEEVSDKVVEVYTRVGELLTRYRAGKVPKAFKIIPSLRNWEEVLLLTNPEKWSSQAMFVATKIFASNLNPKNAQRFYNLILMPAVRDDIRSNRRLNYHLYRSLKKALYKPAAFFKGILLPLCARGEACTLREAIIIGSVMSKVSIPMMHSAAALLKMARMPYSGVTSLFMKVLIDKKYAMPYRVIDAIVAHFMGFMSDTRTMPVIWHQCFLVFAERYHKDITLQQKQSLKALLRTHAHHLITPLIRRELFSGRSRGQKAGEGDDVEMGQ